MQRGLVVGGVGLALALGVTGTASAQTITADLAVNSAYFWRGISYTNKPVLQPDLFFTFGHKLTFTAGGWASIDIGKYDNPQNDISEGGGTAAFNLTEFDWWGEFNLPAGPATLTAGALGYIYPNDIGFTKANNTVEIYGKIALGVPLSPKLAAWYDVDKIKGAYFEASVSLPVHLTPVLPLQFGVLAGFSAGEGCDGGKIREGTCIPTTWNYQDNGLTHIDVSASLPITIGKISLTPNVHGIITSDAITKYAKPSDTNAGFKFLIGLTATWAHLFGAVAE
ncbi:MAG: TorF family putative porin [Gemmatimonadota bacterium]